MKFIKITKKQVELQFEGNEANHPSIAFNCIDLIPGKPEPRRIVISNPRSKKILVMPWKVFLKQGTVGNIVIIPKEQFKVERME